MTTDNIPVPVPDDAPKTDADTSPAGSRARRYRWTVGGFLTVATVAGFWWRRRQRRKQIELEPVSEGWIEDHIYEAGQRGHED